MEVRSPNGTNFPPTPEGKARARRLWDEHEAKTKIGEKAERELTEEQLREHEKILREERETFEQESKEEEVFIREEELQEFKCALTCTGVDAVLELASLLNLDETLKNKLKGTVHDCVRVVCCCCREDS
jgi:hypothetical protein